MDFWAFESEGRRTLLLDAVVCSPFLSEPLSCLGSSGHHRFLGFTIALFLLTSSISIDPLPSFGARTAQQTKVPQYANLL